MKISPESTRLLKKFLFLLILAGMSACSPVMHHGTLSCKTKGQTSSEKTCELSSATAVGEYIMAGNDKNSNSMLMYKKSDLSATAFQRNVMADYKLDFPKNMKIKKIESSTKFKDWNLVFSGFDRTTEPEYTRAIAFKINSEKKVIEDAHLFADKNLHSKMIKLIQEEADDQSLEFLKIEASAVIPDGDGKHLLLLGMREKGQTYHDANKQYRVKIIAFKIKETNGKIVIDEESGSIIYNADDSKFRQFGLSDLTYDSNKKILYMTLSFENEEKISGKLLKISLEDFKKGALPQIIEENLFEGHKTEGVAIFDENKIFILCDDDRSKSDSGDGDRRSLDEARYWILKTE